MWGCLCFWAQPAFEGQRIVAVHGRYDQIVPIGQSSYLEDAVGIFDDTGTHFDVLDPRHDLWLRTLGGLGLDEETTGSVPRDSCSEMRAACAALSSTTTNCTDDRSDPPSNHK